MNFFQKVEMEEKKRGKNFLKGVKIFKCKVKRYFFYSYNVEVHYKNLQQ